MTYSSERSIKHAQINKYVYKYHEKWVFSSTFTVLNERLDY